MKLSREAIQRMTGTSSGGTRFVGGSGGSGSSGGGGSADYAAEAGHAQTADEATHATSAANLDTNSTDWAKILRKDIADTASEVITFAKGLVSTLVSKFKAGIKIGANDRYEIDANGDASLRDVSGRIVTTTGNVSSGGKVTATGNVESGGNVAATGDMSAGGDLTVGGDAIVSGEAKAAQMISDFFMTIGFNDAWLDQIGKGFGVKVDSQGRGFLQTDNLMVLGRMIVNNLNIREVTYIGGVYNLSPAASTVQAVQSLYSSTPSDTRTWITTGSGNPVGYRLLWKADDGTVGTMNYWQQGDQAFCQTFNITEPGEYTNVENQYYWRLVCRVGTVTINGQDYHYADVANTSTCYLYDSDDNPILNAGGGTQFTGYVGNSNTTPKAEDKVVCRGSQRDTTRQGVIIISTEGEASIGIYDGIDYFDDLSNYEVHYMSRTAVRMRSDKFYWRSGSDLKSQSQLITETNQSIANIDVKADRIGIEVTGTTDNLFNNPEFTEGTYGFDGWTRSNSLYVTRDTNVKYEDHNSVKIVGGYGVWQNVWESSDQRLVPGHWHTIKFFIRSTSTTIFNAQVSLEATYPSQYSSIVDISKRVLVDGVPQSVLSNVGVTFNIPISGADKWFMHTISFYVFSNAPTTSNLIVRFSSITGKTVYYSFPRLVCSKTGAIDIQGGSVDIMASNFTLRNEAGEVSMGIDGDGNAEFRGTIKSPNLFHSVCYFMEGGRHYNESEEEYAFCYHLDPDTYDDLIEDGFVVGKYYSKSDLFRMTGGAYSDWDDTVGVFKPCSFKSDIINMIPGFNSQWTGNDASKTVFLPRPEDFFGKTVEIFPTTFGNNPQNVLVGCVRNTAISGTGQEAMTTGLIYWDNTNLRLSLSAATGDVRNTVTITTDMRAMFISVRVYYNSAYRYYWKYLSETGA